MKRLYYGFDRFLSDSRILTQKMAGYSPEAIVAISRGGVSLGHLLSEYYDLRTLYTLNAIHYDDTRKLKGVEIFNVPDLHQAKRVLVVDEIVDSGESMVAIMAQLRACYPAVDFKTAALFQKAEACFEADFWVARPAGWIDFFWEVDLKPESNK
jgi:xanthine phosphoribosyltransferase